MHSLFQANAYFTASATQSHAIKNEDIAWKKEKNILKEESEEWESRTLLVEDQATHYEGKFKGLVKKKQLEFQKLIKVYQKLEAFLKLMDAR